MALGPMAASAGGARRHRRRAVMSEINVTPMVDVMLVLLIIFMVSAPLLTVGVQIDLPQTRANALDLDHDPLKIEVTNNGEVFLQGAKINVDDLLPKLKAFTDAREGADERIYVSGDKNVNYGAVAKVFALVKAAGFHRVALITDVEQGS
jgi:biopolymer transport protein TolR